MGREEEDEISLTPNQVDPSSYSGKQPSTPCLDSPLQFNYPQHLPVLNPSPTLNYQFSPQCPSTSQQYPIYGADERLYLGRSQSVNNPDLSLYNPSSLNLQSRVAGSIFSLSSTSQPSIGFGTDHSIAERLNECEVNKLYSKIPKLESIHHSRDMNPQLVPCTTNSKMLENKPAPSCPVNTLHQTILPSIVEQDKNIETKPQGIYSVSHSFIHPSFHLFFILLSLIHLFIHSSFFKFASTKIFKKSFNTALIAICGSSSMTYLFKGTVK